MKLMKWQKCVNCTNWLPVFRVPFVGARGYEWIVMNLNGLCFGKYIYIPALCSRSWFRQCKQRHVILSSETSRKNKWNVFKPKNRIKQTQNILTKKYCLANAIKNDIQVYTMWKTYKKQFYINNNMDHDSDDFYTIDTFVHEMASVLPQAIPNNNYSMLASSEMNDNKNIDDHDVDDYNNDGYDDRHQSIANDFVGSFIVQWHYTDCTNGNNININDDQVACFAFYEVTHNVVIIRRFVYNVMLPKEFQQRHHFGKLVLQEGLELTKVLNKNYYNLSLYGKLNPLFAWKVFPGIYQNKLAKLLKKAIADEKTNQILV